MNLKVPRRNSLVRFRFEQIPTEFHGHHPFKPEGYM